MSNLLITNIKILTMTQIKTYLNVEYSNKFFKLILDNPDKNWDWNYISYNPNITMKFILDNPDKNGTGMKLVVIITSQ